MGISVQIPTPLRSFTGDQGEVEVSGASTVGEAMRDLIGQHAALEPHLYSEDGELRSFVNLFLNDEDVRYLGKTETPVKDGDTLTIIPSIAGGGAVQEEQPVQDEQKTILPELTPSEIRRYSRHLIMPEVGTVGQQKLKAARVLMVGTGGLGSPLGMYLAAAGVGTLGLVDFDVVDESNLHRQLLYGEADIGRLKLDAAAERLGVVNPNVDLILHHVMLDSSNAMEIVADYDLVVDGTDNFPTRYLVNDACVLSGKPNVYGSIFRFEGQVSVFWAEKGPCYRCLFPEPPPPGLVPSCAEGGVLGVLPGIIGSLQASEVIKLIIGEGEPLIGRLTLFDALQMKFRELKLRRNPECPVCSENPTQTELIDYQQFCGILEPSEEDEMDDIDITPTEVQAMLNAGAEVTILDVRNPPEIAICRLEGSTVIPIAELPDRIQELDPSDFIVAHCHHGPRSTRAVGVLRDAGFPKVKNMAGGIDAWSVEVDPSIVRY